MKRKVCDDLVVKFNKRDSHGLFSGRYKTQIFKSKKEKLKKIQKKEEKYFCNIF